MCSSSIIRRGGLSVSDSAVVHLGSVHPLPPEDGLLGCGGLKPGLTVFFFFFFFFGGSTSVSTGSGLTGGTSGTLASVFSSRIGRVILLFFFFFFGGSTTAGAGVTGGRTGTGWSSFSSSDEADVGGLTTGNICIGTGGGGRTGLATAVGCTWGSCSSGGVSVTASSSEALVGGKG